MRHDREVNTRKCRKYRQTKKGKEAILRAIKKYEENHLERKKAWGKAQELELEPCEICNTTMNIHRHHPNIKEPLMVEFLCALHHKKAHTIIEL